jgi:hypothetical protein
MNGIGKTSLSGLQFQAELGGQLILSKMGCC